MLHWKEEKGADEFLPTPWFLSVWLTLTETHTSTHTHTHIHTHLTPCYSMYHLSKWHQSLRHSPHPILFTRGEQFYILNGRFYGYLEMKLLFFYQLPTYSIFALYWYYYFIDGKKGIFLNRYFSLALSHCSADTLPVSANSITAVELPWNRVRARYSSTVQKQMGVI